MNAYGGVSTGVRSFVMMPSAWNGGDPDFLSIGGRGHLLKMEVQASRTLSNVNRLYNATRALSKAYGSRHHHSALIGFRDVLQQQGGCIPPMNVQISLPVKCASIGTLDGSTNAEEGSPEVSPLVQLLYT